MVCQREMWPTDKSCYLRYFRYDFNKVQHLGFGVANSSSSPNLQFIMGVTLRYQSVELGKLLNSSSLTFTNYRK